MRGMKGEGGRAMEGGKEGEGWRRREGWPKSGGREGKSEGERGMPREGELGWVGLMRVGLDCGGVGLWVGLDCVGWGAGVGILGWIGLGLG